MVFTTRCQHCLQSAVRCSPHAVNTVFSQLGCEWCSPRAVNTVFSQVGCEFVFTTRCEQSSGRWGVSLSSPHSVNTVFSLVGCEWCSPHAVNTVFSQVGCEWCSPRCEQSSVRWGVSGVHHTLSTPPLVSSGVSGVLLYMRHRQLS